MPIPDYQSIMLPLLELASDRHEHVFRDALNELADRFKLTEAERAEQLPSKTQPIWDNRAGWARTYLVKAGLLESPKRGVFQITERGLEILREKPKRVDNRVLKRFPEFREFQTRKAEPDDNGHDEHVETKTPEEVLESGYQSLRQALASDLLARVKSCSPPFFERLVVELLVRMGYGGSLADAGKAVGKSGDEGIDGIIKEDRLGLDVIYLQAKRWERTVGRPEIQQFAGALHGQRARKGVFITTSGYSADAREYVARIDTRITLIDGTELAQLMIDHNVGVATARSYEIKRIDSDYFTEE